MDKMEYYDLKLIQKIFGFNMFLLKIMGFAQTLTKLVNTNLFIEQNSKLNDNENLIKNEIYKIHIAIP